jgi:hypothetical protein
MCARRDFLSSSVRIAYPGSLANPERQPCELGLLRVLHLTPGVPGRAAHELGDKSHFKGGHGCYSSSCSYRGHSHVNARRPGARVISLLQLQSRSI